MRWGTERTDEFKKWWETLSESEQKRVRSSIGRLSALGPGCGRPLVDSVEGSRHSNLKELRATQTIRVFFAFDPRRVAILLIGGNKAGETKRFYRQMVSKADKIYDTHLRNMQEGNGYGR
ncbi:MAG TPA: type II toxin-antitoxin system RelE/ParE family toxin [Solirubrobacterales bacterium]|nr:type II toxin-antitoxin system RelE/ParE family toxin [Solirubrobacterales bacterium]